MKPEFRNPRIGNYLIVHGISQHEYVVVPYKVIKCQTDGRVICHCANSRGHYLLDLQFSVGDTVGVDQYHFCPCIGLLWDRGSFVPRYFIVDKRFFRKYTVYLNLFFDDELYAVKL